MAIEQIVITRYKGGYKLVLFNERSVDEAIYGGRRDIIERVEREMETLQSVPAL
jgi:hypothetical protein